MADWPPELKDIENARFCQDVQNEMFAMITELASVLYGLEWKPGPYQPDMWI